MRMRQIVIVVAIVALVVAALAIGCGKKKKPDTGEVTEAGMGAPAGMPGAPGAPPGMPGAPPGMPGAPPGMGGPPGAPPGMGGPPGAPPGMGGPMGAGAPVMGGADAGSLVAEGMAAKAAGDYAKAESKFRDAIAVDITNEDAHWGLAWMLAGLRQKEEAIAEFQEVIELTIDPERRSESQAAISRLQK